MNCNYLSVLYYSIIFNETRNKNVREGKSIK